MTVVDASVWIAWVDENDSQHAKALHTFEALVAPVSIPEYVLIEVATVLSRKIGRKAAVNFLNFISENRDVKIMFSDPEFLADTVLLFEQTSFGGLSFTDTALLHLSRYHSVVTYDDQLARAIKNLRRGVGVD